MEEKYTQSDQVEWNLSAGVIAEIQNLLSISNRAYLNGNLARSFWCLKTVKFRFIQSLEQDERKSLKKIESDFMKAMKEKKRGSMAFQYDKYTEEIMDYLESYGYLIPKKKDSKRIS